MLLDRIVWRKLFSAWRFLPSFCALALSVFVVVSWTSNGSASQAIADQYPASLLYSKPVEVIPNVWSAIGQTGPSTYENAGHNNNLSFIVTQEGVVVVNGGGSYLLAQALHQEIKAITDQPVRLVIDENGQGHAMLGNAYWGEQGVKILAHEDAASNFEERGHTILESARSRLKDRAAGTEVRLPDETFSDRRVLQMGDVTFEQLDALYVIPGHGHPTNMDQVRRYTLDYLTDLRARIAEHIEKGGGLEDAYYVDQSRWQHLDTFEELATRNAGRVFEVMEFE